MMLKRLIATGLAALLALFALPAFAQDGKQDADSASASVVVLQFETFHVDQEVMDQFYVALHENVDAHDEMHVAPGGDVSINDLILTLGCEEANAECLSGLDQFVEGDRIVFGSVQHSEGVYLLTMQMFDFAQGAFIRQVSDETVEGDQEQVRRGMEAVIQGFLYGDIGQLEVSVTGAEAPTVLFDGEEFGRAPLRAEELSLGEHAVTLQTSDGREQSKKVVLKRGSTSKVHFKFEDAPDVGSSTVGAEGYIVPGWAAVGAGTIGLAAGIIGSVQVGSFESEASSMVCGDALCSASSPTRANKLQDDMDSAYTMSMIGYSVAAVGLVTGGYLLYEGYIGGSAESAPVDAADEDDIAPSTEVSFGIAPRSDGATFGLTVGF